MRQTTPHINPSPGTPHRVYQGTDYTKMDKIFPWSPSRSTRRQTTNMQRSLPLVLLSKYQGTDYTKMDRTNLPLESFLKHQETDYKYADKSSPGTPLEAPRDKLHQEHRSLLLAPLLTMYQETSYIDNKQVFSLSLFSKHQETDYTRDNDRQLSLPLGFLGIHQGTGKRTHASLPLAPLAVYQGTDYDGTLKPSLGTPFREINKGRAT